MNPIKRILLDKAGIETELSAKQKRALLLRIVFETQFNEINQLFDQGKVKRSPLFTYIEQLASGETPHDFDRNKAYKELEDANFKYRSFMNKGGLYTPLYYNEDKPEFKEIDFPVHGPEFLEFYEMCYSFMFSQDFAEHDYNSQVHLIKFFQENDIADKMLIDFR